MKKLVKLMLVAALALTISVPAMAADLPGKGVTVTPARATWSTGFFLEALYSRALEDLGYEVKDAKELSVPIFYQAVKQGDVDFWANGWFPLHDAQLPKGFEKGAKVAGAVAKGGALQGFLASKKDVDALNIKSLEDFKRPEVIKAFDDNGDGKADLVACPPGWGCEKAIDSILKESGLKKYIKPIKANYSASMADALAKYKSGKAIMFYTWTPNWTVYKHKPGKDVVWLNVPETPTTKGTEGKDIAGAVTNPVRMGFVPNDILVVANKKFLAENPAAAKMFEIMSVPLDDIFAQNNKMFQGEKKAKDIERHVDEWIAANKAKWNSWLKAAKAAAK